jgi:hypothetical protein
LAPDFPSPDVRRPLCIVDRLLLTGLSSASIFSQVLIGVDQGPILQNSISAKKTFV